MFYLSLSFLPRDKICFYCIHAREGVVLKKVLLPSPSPVIHFFFFLLLPQLSRRTSRGNACYAG